MAYQYQKRVPWTEIFRPRSLYEVIMTSRMRNQILNWWRAWIILWNLFRIWNNEERTKWMDFLKTSQGKEWANKYLRKWRTFFQQEFEKWAGAPSRGETPKSHTLLFQMSGKETSTDLKPTALREIRKWLDKLWGKFLSQTADENVPPAIPPLSPYKPLLLVGPPGTGKTSTAYALAWQEGVMIVEFNASDRRSGSVVREIVKEALKSAGFVIGGDPSKPPRIILLDEVDGLSARDDRGGFAALMRILDEIKLPLIFTANVIHDRKVRALMTRCVTIFFDRPQEYQAKALIKRIVSRMKMDVPDRIVNFLAKYAPDFRTIIEALEVYYYSGVLPEIFHEEMLSLQDAIRYAFGFKGKNLEESISRAQRYLGSVTDVDPWELILWVWENAYSFLDHSKGLFGFYNQLALADYLYKIGARNMNWRIAYRDAMRVLATAMARYGRHAKNVWELRKIKVNKPTIIEELYRMKQLMEGQLEEEGEAEEAEEINVKKLGLRPLLERYARYTHTSRKRARRELRFLIHLARAKPEIVGELFAKLYVPKETISIFTKYAFKSKKERSEIEGRILNAYEETLNKIGPRAEFLKMIPPISEKAEEKKVKEVPEEKKEAKKKPKKKEEEAGKVTLDKFFG